MLDADPNLSDTEIVPFSYPGGIGAFLDVEVHPYAPDAYVDASKTKVGYEVDFAKYFYKPTQLRSVSEIVGDLRSLEEQASGMLDDICEGLMS